MASSCLPIVPQHCTAGPKCPAHQRHVIPHVSLLCISPQTRRCSTCPASPWPRGCAQSPQTPPSRPCLRGRTTRGGSRVRGRAAAHLKSNQAVRRKTAAAPDGIRAEAHHLPRSAHTHQPGPAPHPSWRPACQSRRGAHPGRGSHRTPVWQQKERQAWVATVNAGLMQQPDAAACVSLPAGVHGQQSGSAATHS